MKAKEFLILINKPLTYIDTVDNYIINLVIDSTQYGLAVDLKDVVAGTPLTRTDNFTIENDILTSGSMSVNLAETDMLGMTAEKVKEVEETK